MGQGEEDEFWIICMLECRLVFSAPQVFLNNPTLIKHGVSFSWKMVSLKVK